MRINNMMRCGKMRIGSVFFTHYDTDNFKNCPDNIRQLANVAQSKLNLHLARNAKKTLYVRVSEVEIKYLPHSAHSIVTLYIFDTKNPKIFHNKEIARVACKLPYCHRFERYDGGTDCEEWGVIGSYGAFEPARFIFL